MNTKTRQEKKAKRQRPSLLDEVLERRMLLYVLAAGATLAGASGAAQAKVIFTPSNAQVSPRHPLDIDLNNDGTTDFVISASGSSSFARRRSERRADCGNGGDLYAAAAIPSNGLEATQSNGLEALENGTVIPNPNSNPKFIKGGIMALLFYGSQCQIYRGGAFDYTQNRFLGARFIINGQVHYGWIGFRYAYPFGAGLYGWAYETEPNKPIRAINPAFTPPLSSSVGPTSLELLAAGHVAVADWRRRNAAVVAPVASPS